MLGPNWDPSHVSDNIDHTTNQLAREMQFSDRYLWTKFRDINALIGSSATLARAKTTAEDEDLRSRIIGSDWSLFTRDSKNLKRDVVYHAMGVVFSEYLWENFRLPLLKPPHFAYELRRVFTQILDPNSTIRKVKSKDADGRTTYAKEKRYFWADGIRGSSTFSHVAWGGFDVANLRVRHELQKSMQKDYAALVRALNCPTLRADWAENGQSDRLDVGAYFLGEQLLQRFRRIKVDRLAHFDDTHDYQNLALSQIALRNSSRLLPGDDRYVKLHEDGWKEPSPGEEGYMSDEPDDLVSKDLIQTSVDVESNTRGKNKEPSSPSNVAPSNAIGWDQDPTPTVQPVRTVSMKTKPLRTIVSTQRGTTLASTTSSTAKTPRKYPSSMRKARPTVTSDEEEVEEAESMDVDHPPPSLHAKTASSGRADVLEKGKDVRHLQRGHDTAVSSGKYKFTL